MSKESQQESTYNAIVARCKNLIPPIDIISHIKPGTLQCNQLVLDGINFEANDPVALENEFRGRMLPKAGDPVPAFASKIVPTLPSLTFDTSRGPRSANASMIGMKEDPDHWALKASFGATIGEGFREQWQPPPQIGVGIPRLAEPKYGKSDPLNLAFGEPGHTLKFTALHAAVAPPPLQTKKRGCNIHIDERGFVVKLPDGAVVTPTSWSHIANELLLKTKFRDWLDGLIGDNLVGGLVVEAVNRLNLRFSDAENGFAGLPSRVNGMSGLRDAYKAFMPIGISYDLFKFNNSTMQANYYSYDGQKTLTLTWSGTWENPPPEKRKDY
ncbi:MAG TPA: hypothetical protein VM452_00700 [Caulifigura sp.]|jgi:hypothetical protein|nr:hypothetical protein [Caulifigura sp.]